MGVRSIGISQELRRRAFSISRNFFAQTAQEKQQLGYGSAADNFGYQGIGEEKLAPDAPPDLKEAITLRDVLARTDGRWADTELQSFVEEFYRECLAAAHRLQRVFAAALDLDSEFFVQHHSGENVTMRMLHYPPLQVQEASQLGAGEHTDYGMLTLLFQDQQGGLEVQGADGHWIGVEPDDEIVVVNTGDLTERWTNGYYRSTSHRVQPRSNGEHRYSIAFFVDPDSSTTVSCLPSCVDEKHPLQFEPVNAGEHILSKLEATQRDQ